MSHNIRFTGKGSRAQQAFQSIRTSQQLQHQFGNLMKAFDVAGGVLKQLSESANPTPAGMAEMAEEMNRALVDQVRAQNPNFSKPEFKKEFDGEYNVQLLKALIASPARLIGTKYLAEKHQRPNTLKLCQLAEGEVARLKNINHIHAPSKEAEVDNKATDTAAAGTASAATAAGAASAAAQPAASAAGAAAQVVVVEEPKKQCANNKCKQTATKVCACKKVFYCNEHCQKAHWKKHKPDCTAKKAK